MPVDVFHLAAPSSSSGFRSCFLPIYTLQGSGRGSSLVLVTDVYVQPWLGLEGTLGVWEPT